MEDATRAEQLIRNLARRLDKEWPGIAATILEGIDEILCVVRLPKDLRRSLACTNIIENMNGTIRQVTRNVKRWRDGSMVLSAFRYGPPWAVARMWSNPTASCC
jgi:putative transposase